MLPKEWGKVAVLQPRRIAARNLAWRVAQERGCPLGAEVGYRVRFESKVSEQTRITYQTFGVFFQSLLDAPAIPDLGVVIFDEFHERALECDAALAHCLRLQASGRRDLRIVVMSATLESQSLAHYLEPASLVEVASPLYPVEIRHQNSVQQEPVWNAALRAARGLLAQGFGGSALVFMPGVGEIRRTCEALEPMARHAGMGVFELHGGMDLEAQQKVLQAPQRGPCFVVATNVAETSLTLPGITAVIDSGLQRVAAYNPERDMDTLYLKSISLHSATQRMGRAGRLGPGKCIRLWSPERERAMPASLEPEVRRVDLTPMALKLHLLAGEALHHPTHPVDGALSPSSDSKGGDPTDGTDATAMPKVGGASERPEPEFQGSVQDTLRNSGPSPSSSVCEVAGTTDATDATKTSGPTDADDATEATGPANAADATGIAGPRWKWLDAPEPSRWQHAIANLESIGALSAGSITAIGRKLLRWSLHPVPARALLAAQESGDVLVFDIVAAMAAILESEGRRNPQATADLYIQGRDLVRDPKDRQVDPETRESWRRLRAMGPKGLRGNLEVHADLAQNAGPELREAVTRCFLPAFVDHLASRIDQTQSFLLADGRKGVADAKSVSSDVQALLALEMHETGGAGKARQISIPVLLPVGAETLAALWPYEMRTATESLWDESRGRQIIEERTSFRGLLVKRKSVEGAAKPDATETLVKKLVTGEFVLPGFNDQAQQILWRIRLAAKTCPDAGLPAMDEDDWCLIYHDLCEGKTSLKQLESADVCAALRDYLGYSLWNWLERETPASYPLPGGKRARITYSENGPPEMSARLGDFVGMQGKTFILQKRVAVNYDILAPNYRTVQKTQDLTSFWENTYPEVKKELKRRYPRHPWP